MTIVTALLTGLAGILVGGVVNALADYLPPARAASLAGAASDIEGPVVDPPRATPQPLRPHYPDGSSRPASAWLGILAFLTGQRSSSEGSRLSWRHPVTELALAMAYMVATLSSEWGLQAFFHLIFLTILLLITVIDLEHKLILFVVIVPSCLIAVLASVLVPSSPPDLGDALGGGLAGFFVFFLMFLGGLGFSRLIHTDEIAFGFGDVMLGTLSGLILGWQALIFALFLTIFLGAGGAILYLGSRMILHNRYSWFTAIPYGPYIALSTVLVMLWREEIRALIW